MNSNVISTLQRYINIEWGEREKPTDIAGKSLIDQLRNLVAAPSRNMETRLIMQIANFYFLLCP